MATVLVTGATGFIGSHVARLLVERGDEVVLAVEGGSPDTAIEDLHLKRVKCDVRDRRATYGPSGLEPWVDRVTMTLPTLVSADRIVFLVTGEDKADAVSRAFGGAITDDVPASLIRQAPVPVEVFLDGAAAVRLAP